MFQTPINIERKLAVINGFVEIPDLQRTAKTQLTPEDVLLLIPGSERIRVGLPSRIVDQEWIKLPSFERFPDEDIFQILRAAAS